MFFFYITFTYWVMRGKNGSKKHFFLTNVKKNYIKNNFFLNIKNTTKQIFKMLKMVTFLLKIEKFDLNFFFFWFYE